jgi:hypothetical protein
MNSDQNNYLTMNTSKGSFAMTDGGANISARLTDKFRVGAQVYARNIGDLGKYHLQLDWGYADYKFKDSFGVRAGKIKTALGLLNDTQDMEFLQTWALLPQSVYPLDLRSNTIAHAGVDIYGQIGLRKAGNLMYTAYYGSITNDKRSGVYYSAADKGYPITSYSGTTTGGDLRWNTPLQGLMLGGSWADTKADIKILISGPGNLYLTGASEPQRLSAFYGDFARGRWHFSGELRKKRQIFTAIIPGLGPKSYSNLGDRGKFVTAAFRVSKFLEVGAYHSRFYVDTPINPNPAAAHMFDQTITARFDINKWWNIKVEEHFIRGYGDTYSSHGFYLRNNPGISPNTNMFVIRTGFSM